MDLEFDVWFDILKDKAAQHGEFVADEDAWKADYEEGKSPEEAFFDEFPEHS